MKEKKKKIIIGIIILAVLVLAFWYGGGAPGMRGWNIHDSSGSASEDTTLEGDMTNREGALSGETGGEDADADSGQDSKTGDETVKPVISDGKGTGMDINAETGKDKYMTDPVPEGKPLPVEPQDVKVNDTAYTCTISISCETILDNMEYLTEGKESLVPSDGVILAPTKVTFYEGESVFNVLQRTCKQNKIHMEFSNTPIYNSAYIEGINNLYEFDCGELSGWMYSVNGWFPNYGCSRYQLRDGDVVKWVFTCDLGTDVGGGYAVGE